MNYFLLLLTVGVGLLSGCHVSSRIAMYGSGGRTAYNMAAQNTTNQELLLNLVRLRYSDTPYFLELNGITTQINFSSKLNASMKIPGLRSKDFASIGGEFGWSSRPTIQYSPLEGKQFAMQMMQPLNLKMIQALILTGWDVDRVFRLLIQNIANIQNANAASGPVPFTPPLYKKFLECLALLRHFQSNGELQIGVCHIPNQGKDISEEEASAKIPNALQISFPSNGEQSHRLAELLKGTKTSEGHYVLNIRQAFNEKAALGLMTRSLLGTMYYLSLGVQVPQKDVSDGTVALTLNEDGTPFDWNELIGEVLTIHSSESCPDSYYLAVPYRDHWFYIDDTDINSKRTFVLLQQVYNLQAKDQDKESLPPLTIPLSSS